MWQTKGLPSTQISSPIPTKKTQSIQSQYPTPHQHKNEVNWIDTQPTNSQRHIDLGTHMHAKQDVTCKFDKKRCCPSTAPRNDIMNSLNNTPFGIPNSWLFSHKTTIHIQKLDKTDHDKVHWKSIKLPSRFLNSSSYPGHELLNKSKMNNLCLLKHKAQWRCLRLK
jgi:hypothetical protein